MKKVKNKPRLCGNCALMGRNKIIPANIIYWSCPTRWWIKRPNNIEGCKDHKFKREVQ